MSKYREFAIDKGYDLLVGVPATAAFMWAYSYLWGFLSLPTIGIGLLVLTSAVSAVEFMRHESRKAKTVRDGTPRQTTTTITTPKQGDQSQIIDNLLFSLLAGSWLKTYCWQGRTGSETAVIDDCGFYRLNSPSSPPIFYLANAWHDSATREVQFTLVRLQDGRPVETWDVENLTLSDDQRKMTGTSETFGTPVEYTRMAPEGSTTPPPSSCP
jgi:hypothetical protein